MEQTQRQLGSRGPASLRVLSQRHELQNQTNKQLDARLNRARLAALLFCPPMAGHDDWAMKIGLCTSSRWSLGT